MDYLLPALLPARRADWRLRVVGCGGPCVYARLVEFHQLSTGFILEATAARFIAHDLADRALRHADVLSDLSLSHAGGNQVGDEKFPVHGPYISTVMDKVNSDLMEFSNIFAGMKTIAERLRSARKQAGLSQEALAKKAGVSQGLIGQIEGGRNQGSKHVASLARALDISADWLASGVGPRTRLTVPTEVGGSTVSVPAYNPLAVPGDNFIPGPDIRGMIPLISWVQAGNWSEVVKAFTEEDAEEWLPALRAISRRAFALRVEGQSMEPVFRHGEIIYVDPEVQAEHGKYVVVQLEDEPQATFKSLVIEAGQKFLRPLNPDWPGPKFIPINGNATIIGVVVGKWTPI